MADKETIERLRTMIREMELKAKQEEDFFSQESRLSPGHPAPSSPPSPEGSPHFGSLECTTRGSYSENGFVAPREVKVEDQPHYRVYNAIYPEGSRDEFRKVGGNALEGLRAIEPSLGPEDKWLFMDIETTGLLGAATLAFLVGLGLWTPEGFAVTQYLLKDREDEELMLSQVAARFRDCSALVTFNGKAFDVPVLQSRFVMTGARMPVLWRTHLDLLTLVKNMGKRPTYGQSLKEAMRRFAGWSRDGDIPGSLIPALYFVYEREGDISVLDPVVKHNRMDIVDMVCLIFLLAQILSGNADLGDAVALAGAGKLHFRKGNLDLAKRCLESASPEASTLRILGHVLRKEGDWQGSARIFERIVSSGDARDEDVLWLARCYELGSGDLKKSLEVVDKAIVAREALGEEPSPLLIRRKGRLERRIFHLKPTL